MSSWLSSMKSKSKSTLPFERLLLCNMALQKVFFTWIRFSTWNTNPNDCKEHDHDLKTKHEISECVNKCFNFVYKQATFVQYDGEISLWGNIWAVLSNSGANILVAVLVPTTWNTRGHQYKELKRKREWWGFAESNMKSNLKTQTAGLSVTTQSSCCIWCSCKI